jgi:hypothetical protein
VIYIDPWLSNPNGAFPVLTGTVQDFQNALGSQIKLLAPTPGDTVEF